MVKRYEHELENKLLSDQLGKKNVRFNLDGILRGDTATRGEYLSKMVASQIMTQNEARAVENLNPVQEGDKFLSPYTTPGNNNNDEEN